MVHLTASPAVLAERLMQRGRETAEEIAARLAREKPVLNHAFSLLAINNDGPIEQGGGVVVALLQELALHSGELGTSNNSKARG